MLKFQLSQRNSGVTELADLTLNSATARIGNPGSPPEAGTFQLVINPPETASNVTAAIPYNFTAQQLEDAINDLGSGELGALHPCTVVQANGRNRIKFADNTAAVEIGVAENALWPVSFVNVKEQAWDEGNLYILTVVQTSFAVDSTLQTRPPDLPTITRKQAGSSEDGIITNEIQRLTIPASYAGGAFQLDRDGRLSNLIALPTSEEELAAAIAPIKEEGGQFLVRSSSKAFYIEFSGSMGGEPHDLLTVVPFDPPADDNYLKISTGTAEMESLMAVADGNGEAKAVLHLTLLTENELDALDDDKTIFRVPLTFTVPPSDNSNNVSQNLIWNQPPSRTTLLPHSLTSRLVGHRHAKFVIGDGSQISFPLPHNLNGEPVEVAVDAAANTFTAVGHNFHNLDPITYATDDTLPPEVEEGKTYWVTERTDDTWKISERMGGDPIDLTGTGSGTITAMVNDGGGDAVLVSVWERSGNKARLPEDSYTVERTSLSTVTLKDFPATPTEDQYDVFITTAGRPSQWQDAEWPTNRVIGLEEWQAGIEARLAAVEDKTPNDFRRVESAEGSYDAKWAVPPFAEIYPQQGRATVQLLPGQPLAAFDKSTLPRVAPKLFPAVHQGTAPAALETTTSGGITFPAAASSSNEGKVYENAGATDVFLPIGLGWYVKPGEYVASDGVEWYPVEQYGSAPGSSYYPAHLSRVLWEDTVEAEQLAASRTFGVRIATEISVMRANTPVYCHFVYEVADLTQDDSPGTPGGNIKADAWVADPVLSQRLTLTSSPRPYLFGYRVARDSGGDLTAEKLTFGSWQAATAPPSARFGIRLRLIRLDTVNAVADPQGFIAYTGPNVEAISGTSGENNLNGFAYVK